MVNNYGQDEEKYKFSFKSMLRMFDFVKTYKSELVKAFFLGIISSIFFLIIPRIMAYAIDVSFVNKDFREIIILAFIILILIIIGVILNKIKDDKLSITLNNLAMDIKMAIFIKLQYLPSSYYHTRSHGKIYTRATSYPDDVSAIFCYVLVQGILDIINLIFVIIFMLVTNVKLSVVSIILSLILVVFFILISPIKRKYQGILNDKSANVNAYLAESINGIKITQSFNRESKNEQILKDLEHEKLCIQKKTLFLNNANWSLSVLFNYVSMILIFYIGFKYFYPGISIGIIMAIDSYSSRFWEPIEYLTSSYGELIDASTYLERIFEVLDEPLVISDSSKAISLDIKGDVSLKGVKFAYNSDNIVLDNLNIEIKRGKRVGLVGATGSGKSTILSLLSRFYDVEEGEILIDNVNIKDIKLSSLRGQVAMMLQDNFLFETSVYDNLVMGKNVSLDEVIKICKLLEIHDIIMNLEGGYETILLNNASNLSVGERQLLCLARIMIQDPKILILDEATSNIDLITEQKLEHALNIVMKGRTTIMVAHRISTIKSCDKIVLIKNHCNFEEGTHQELMEKRGEYYKLYTAQGMQNVQKM